MNYLERLKQEVEQIKDEKIKEELKKRIKEDRVILEQWDTIKNFDKLLKEIRKIKQLEAI